MAPVEWPIAERSDAWAATSTRRVDGDRLSAARVDLFLDPSARLTEQERALMTAMLADLVAVIADEVGSMAGVAAGEESGELFERMFDAGLLDIPDLIAALLRRAEQERVGEAIRANGSGGGGRFLHSLAARDDADISAPAMALILGRSRRRDRFDQPRMDFNDVPADSAHRLVHAVAATLGRLRAQASDRQLCDAAAAVLGRHDEGRRMDSLAFAMVHALDSAGELDDETLRTALADGEVALLAEALARRAGLNSEAAWAQLVAGGSRLGSLLRMARVSRPLAATVAAAIGDSVAGAAEAIAGFDSLSDEDAERMRSGLRLDRTYRDALAALGGTDGDSSD